MIVVTIITVLLLILLPAIQRSICQANATVCMHNLKEIHRGLAMYRLENDGYVPANTEAGEQLDENAWFDDLVPRYVSDAAVFTCPDDPYQHRIHRSMAAGVYGQVGTTSYGLSSFVHGGENAHLANLDRHPPRRLHDTLLVADLGPDSGGTASLQGPTISLRATGELPWDDSFDPGAVVSTTPWITERHFGAIHGLAFDGSLHRVRTREIMTRAIVDYYADCAAGDCALCSAGTPHYSFAQSHIYWWTGPVPNP